MRKLLLMVICGVLVLGVSCGRTEAPVEEPPVIDVPVEETPEAPKPYEVHYSNLEKSLTETLIEKGVAEESARKTEELLPGIVALSEYESDAFSELEGYLLKDGEGQEFEVYFDGDKLCYIQVKGAVDMDEVIYMDFDTEEPEEPEYITDYIPPR